MDDRNPGFEEQPTFQQGGIAEGAIERDTKGSSCIDFAFTNQAGNVLIKDAEHMWEWAMGLDHVPMKITVDTQYTLEVY